MAGNESHLHMQQPIEALAEQPCTPEQHHGRSQFQNNQFRSNAPPACSRAAATTVCQTSTQVGEWKTQGRSNCKQNTSNQHKRSREYCYMPMTTFAQIGHSVQHVSRDQFEQQLPCECCGEEPQCAACGDRNEALSDKLLYEASASGAKRTADSKFTPAVFRSNHEKTRHVDVCNQQ